MYTEKPKSQLRNIKFYDKDYNIIKPREHEISYSEEKKKITKQADIIKYKNITNHKKRTA